MERQFEWDDEKAIRNWKDHRVSFDEAVEVFRDLNGIEEIDEDHSTEEGTRFYRIDFRERGCFMWFLRW